MLVFQIIHFQEKTRNTYACLRDVLVQVSLSDGLQVFGGPPQHALYYTDAALDVVYTSLSSSEYSVDSSGTTLTTNVSRVLERLVSYTLLFFYDVAHQD